MNEQIHNLAEAIKNKRPVLAEVLNNFGHMTLSKYSALFKNTKNVLQKTIQSKDDFVNICGDYTERLIGKNAAVKIKKRLTDFQDILTANHHGPTFSYIQIQGEIVYALSEKADDIMPVFAFGDIPLNNVTYPRGIMLSSNEKLPLFPDSKKNSLVSFVEAYTEDSVAKALNKADKLFSCGKLSEREYKTICCILNEVYLDNRVLACSSYSEQSVIINAKLWDMIFETEQERYMPERACIEIEKIVSQLLETDLYNKKSLIYNIFFNSSLRNNILSDLDKMYGCWDNEKLKTLSNCVNELHQQRRELLAGSGTAFFWGIDSKKRRIPLYLNSIDNKLYLSGIDDSGENFKIRFDQQSLRDALCNGLILPSLFTCFSAVSFARGYECYGGFMQTDYLTNMRNGLGAALEHSNYTEWAKIVSSVKTDNFCTGLQFILQKRNNGKIYPAGTIEIIASGGLSKKDIDLIRKTPLEHANYMGMPIRYPTVFRKKERNEELENITVDDIFSELGGSEFLLLE